MSYYLSFFDILVVYLEKKSSTHSDLDIIHLRFFYSSPSLHQQKGQVYLLNYLVGLLVFEIEGETNHYITTNSQHDHCYPY